MSVLFRKGVVMEQHKEPAASREIRRYTENIVKSRKISVGLRSSDLTPDDVIEIARKAEIVDETDQRPLADKLRAAQDLGYQSLIADALDDEPFVSSRLALVLHMQEELASGLRLAAKAMGTEDYTIAVYNHLMELDSKIPAKVDGIKVRQIGGPYPAQQVIRQTGKKKKQLLIGAGALVHLHRAVFTAQVQNTVFMTVAGDCVANSSNVEIPLGMPVSKVLEFCGYAENPTLVILGGSMTGKAVDDCEHTTIGPGDRAVLAMRVPNKKAGGACIGCGRCIKVCPESLPVYYMFHTAQQRLYREYDSFPFDGCTHCGACSYICPAGMDIVGAIASFEESYLTIQANKLQTLELTLPPPTAPLPAAPGDIEGFLEDAEEIVKEYQETLQEEPPAEAEIPEIPQEAAEPAEAMETEESPQKEPAHLETEPQEEQPAAPKKGSRSKKKAKKKKAAMERAAAAENQEDQIAEEPEAVETTEITEEPEKPVEEPEAVETTEITEEPEKPAEEPEAVETAEITEEAEKPVEEPEAVETAEITEESEKPMEEPEENQKIEKPSPPRRKKKKMRLRNIPVYAQQDSVAKDQEESAADKEGEAEIS